MWGAVPIMQQAASPVVELSEEFGANQPNEFWVCSQQASSLMQWDSTCKFSAISTPPERRHTSNNYNGRSAKEKSVHWTILLGPSAGICTVLLSQHPGRE